MPILRGDNDLTVTVGSQGDTSGIKKIESEVTGLGNHVSNMGGIIKGVLAGAAVGSIAALGQTAISAAADFEQTEIAFNGILQSGQKTQAFLSDLRKFAAATPFEFPELATASKNLLAVGFSAQEVIPIMTKIGNVAATLGVGGEQINSVVRALGQMRGKGKVSAEELNQISEAIPGFSSIGAIAKGVGLTTTEAFAAIEKGAIPVDDAIKALFAGMEQFPGAAGAMGRQSQTINGLMSTLRDTIHDTSINIGNMLINAFNLHQNLQTLITSVAGLSGWVQNNLIPGIQGLITQLQGGVMWFEQNRTTIEAVATVIGFALLPQMVALGLQLVKNIALWGIHAVVSLAQNIANAYLFITSGWQMVGVLIAQAVRLGISTAAWTANTIAATANFILSGQLNASWLAMNAIAAVSAIRMGIVTAAQWALNVALSANPIGLIIIAIGALVALLVASSGHWDDFKKAAVSAIETVLGWITKIVDAIKNIPSVKDFGKALHVPGFADGVTNFSGGPALVGEKGPELVNLPKGSSVTPTDQLGGITVNQTNNIYNQVDMNASMRELGWQIAVR